jgi:hypothetical protein
LDRHALESLPHHARASYTLERGVWTATCRICGYTTRDAIRGRAAGAFLVHIRAGRQGAGRQDAGRTSRSAGFGAPEDVRVADPAGEPAKLIATVPEVIAPLLDRTYPGGTRKAIADSEG